MKKGFKPLAEILGSLFFVLVLLVGVAMAQPIPNQAAGPPADVKKRTSSAEDIKTTPAKNSPAETAPAQTVPANILPAGEQKEIKEDWFQKHIIESSLVVQYKKGGFIMYFILACSIGGLYIYLERSYSVRSKRMLPPQLLEKVLGALPKGDIDIIQERKTINTLMKICLKEDIPLTRCLKAGLMVHTEGIAGAKVAITTANEREGALLSKGVPVLGMLSNIAPLLGLLGTVTGMIKAFDMLSAAGAGKPEVVASGISEALVTTAGGLFVGIPLLVLTNLVQGKIDNILLDMEEFALEVIERLVYRGEGEDESEEATETKKTGKNG